MLLHSLIHCFQLFFKAAYSINVINDPKAHSSQFIHCSQLLLISLLFLDKLNRCHLHSNSEWSNSIPLHRLNAIGYGYAQVLLSFSYWIFLNIGLIDISELLSSFSLPRLNSKLHLLIEFLNTSLRPLSPNALVKIDWCYHKIYCSTISVKRKIPHRLCAWVMVTQPLIFLIILSNFKITYILEIRFIAFIFCFALGALLIPSFILLR